MADNQDDAIRNINESQLEFLIQTKYRLVYSERLGRKVYTLLDWIDKSVFKKHKKLFGYTDIGWTVKHPKQLIRALLSDGVWKLDLNEYDEYLDQANDENNDL